MENPMMNRWISVWSVGVVAVAWMAAEVDCCGAEERSVTEPLYNNDFESAEVGKMPDEFLVLDGDFLVKSDGANSFLELPGSPLESFGVMFGPTENAGVAVTARIFGTTRGRRMPTFAVALNGIAGYRLRVSAAKRLIELYKGDSVVQTVPYRWKSGVWTWLRLQVRKEAGDEWDISGKVWVDGAHEPNAPVITWRENEEPFSGRASVWGSPYSGKPILFDNFSVTRIAPQP